MGKKPVPLAVPLKPADEAPEATPRTIEGGPPVEPDAYGIYHAANTPVGHRSSRGNRAAFTASGSTENRAEQLLISQMQTPERHRAGQGSYYTASPLPNLSSPGLFGSPNPVPLFQPSPKRHGMQSPGHHTGFEALFQSPMRGFNAELQPATDLLRFETPSRQPALESFISPSPNKHVRRHLPGSQGRRGRSVAFEVASWRHAEEAAALTGGDDPDFDLVQNLLQSPGPKEVQLLQQEHQRSKLSRSTSNTPAGSPWSSVDPAAAGGGVKPSAHRRRALDFSKAEQMHRDLQVLPVLQRRSGKHGSGSGAGSLNSLADAAAAFGAEQHQAGRDLDPAQHLDQQQSSKFQPDLPLLPLDLTECERHNPNSTMGLTPLGGNAAAAGAHRHKQHAALFADPFTSPRSTLDAAAAVVAGHAMSALRTMHGSSQEQQQAVTDAALRSMAALPSSAFSGRGGSSSKLKAALGDSSVASPNSNSKTLPVMVPLDNLSAAGGVGGDIAKQVLQLLQADSHGRASHQDSDQGADDYHSSRYQQERASVAEDTVADGEDGDDHQPSSSAAARRRSTSAGRRTSLRQLSRRSSGASDHHPQQQQQPPPAPSRRSRRIAGSAVDAPEQRERTASPPPKSGSGGRSRRTACRTADAEQYQQQEQHGHDLEQQQEDEDLAAPMDVDEPAEDEQQQLGLEEGGSQQADGDAADDDDLAGAADNTARRSRGRAGSSRKGSGQKSTRSKAQQQQLELEHSQQGFDQAAAGDAAAGADGDAAAGADGDAAAGADGDAAAGADGDAAAAAAAAGLAAAAAAGGLDVTVLGSQAAFLPGLQQLAQLQMAQLQSFGVTPDKRGSRLGGGMLGPNTPDDVRMAHLGLQFAGNMRSCHCKKSQCLKLYCDCFANNTFCNGCACMDCKNIEANAQEVMAKRVNIQQRDPNAFAHKLAQRADTLTNRKGCKCKKSHCLKKYCECYQLGVRCGDLCKCVDCHNCGEIDGTSLPMPTTMLQHPTMLSASAGQQQRMQHAVAAAAAAGGAYWPMGQALPAVSAGAVTPSTSVTLAQAQAQAQLLLRLQQGVPGTPCSAPLVAGLALQQGAPTAAAAAAAAALGLVLSQPLAVAGSADGSAEGRNAAASTAPDATPVLTAAGSTPQPPKSAGRLSVERGSLRSTAKPLLPEFMQAAEAAASGGNASSVRKMLLHTSAAAADRTEDQLPTPDQAGAEHHLLQLRDTSSEVEAAAAAAAAAAEAVGAAAAAEAAARHLFDAAALAGASNHQAEYSSYSGQQQRQQPGFISSPVEHPSSKVRHQSPDRARAATSSSSGGDSRSGPLSSAVPGSVTSKGRHRLASSSRACEDEASTKHMPQQQLQPQKGLAALVPGSSAAAAAACSEQGGQMSNTRRQLLQQIQEEAAGLSGVASAVHAWQQQHTEGYDQALAAAAAAGAPASEAVPAADTGARSNSSSPGQPVLLGPNGPTVVLPQHVLRSAMSQGGAALNLNAAPVLPPVAALGGDSSAAGQDAAAAAGAPRQTAGMLMTVVDEQGCVQYYFLPNSQPAAVDAAGTQETAGLQQQLQQDEQQQDDQQQQEPQGDSVCQAQTYALRSRAHKSHSPVNDHMQVDALTAASSDTQPQYDEPGSRMATRHHHPEQQQQQPVFTTPTKERPADEEHAVPAAAAAVRSLRSSSAAGGSDGVGGASCRTTPPKRATPVKRKADAEDTMPMASPQQQGPSPAKMPHQLSSPPSLTLQGLNHQQASPSQRVVLSPVKLATAAIRHGAFSNAAGADGQAASRGSQRGAGSSTRAQPKQQEQPQQLLVPAAAPQEMQLFLATTADGQQLLLRAPAGTDPQALIGADGSVQSCYLAAVLPNAALAATQQQEGAAAQQAAAQQAAEQQQQYARTEQLLQQQSPSSRRPTKQLHVEMPNGGTYASPGRLMASPSKLMASPSGLMRFSPGKTVFGPKGTSPSKPLLGNSPGRC